MCNSPNCYSSNFSHFSFFSLLYLPPVHKYQKRKNRILNPMLDSKYKHTPRHTTHTPPPHLHPSHLHPHTLSNNLPRNERFYVKLFNACINNTTRFTGCCTCTCQRGFDPERRAQFLCKNTYWHQLQFNYSLSDYSILMLRKSHNHNLISFYKSIHTLIQSYHIISYHIISYHIISYHIIPYHIISYHIISYHIISYHIISYHIISYHIISTLFHKDTTSKIRTTKIIWRSRLESQLGL